MTSAIRRNAGRKAKTSGREFEKFLAKWVFPEVLRTGFFKRIDKLNPDHCANLLCERFSVESHLNLHGEKDSPYRGRCPKVTR